MKIVLNNNHGNRARVILYIKTASRILALLQAKRVEKLDIKCQNNNTTAKRVLYTLNDFHLNAID